MGVILKDKLEDFPAAETEFETLLNRYPDNIYRLDAYYNLYLMFTRAGNMTKAELYRSLILSDFPDSKYGIAMRDPDYIGNLRRMMEIENRLYDDALQAYFDNDNARVHSVYNTVSTEYPLSKLMPKFMFLEALAYVTDHNSESFKNTLMLMLERYPDTDLSPYASSYLKGLAQGKKLNEGAANMRGMLWDTRLSNDSTAVASDTPVEFEINADDEQYLILLYPTDIISPNGLLYDVARHNFASFVVKDFDLEQMNFGRLGLLIIKGFKNLNEINHYRKVMAASQSMKLPPEIRPVVISAKNFDTLLKSGRSFDDYFSFMRDKTYRNTEESVLPPEFFGPSEGLSPEEAAESPVVPAPQPSSTSDTSDMPDTSDISDKSDKTAQPDKAGVSDSQTQPVEKSPKPNPASKPASPPTPSLPEFDPGSEGDDPLLD